MGTRGSFWVGDPKDLENREWLGCIAWDAHIQNFLEWADIASADEFRAAVSSLHERRDFAHPEHGWPFPWHDDVFLTDRTYAFFDGAVQVCDFYSEFHPIRWWIDEGPGEIELPDVQPKNVPAPSPYNPTQPDSILILTRRGPTDNGD